MVGCCIFPLPDWPPPNPPQPPQVLDPPAPPTSLSPTTGALGYTNSSYGNMIPIVFGSDRVTGNVIWASKPVTINTTIDGLAYNYQIVSFAIALCEGTINGVRKIWAGPKLALDNTLDADDDAIVIPPTNGTIGSYQADFTDPTGPFSALDPSARGRLTKVTVYNGDEDQIAEGIIASTEGYENTPAYRGVAYVLFEDFPIEQNNLPALFFEVISHTVTDAPRLYSDFVGTTFNTQKFEMLVFDPSYDRYYTLAQKTSPAARGLQVVDASTLEELAQFEIENYYSIGPRWDTTVVCPSTGILFTSNPNGNRGDMFTINPLSGGVLDSIIFGGGLLGHGIEGNGINIGMAGLNGRGVVAFTCPIVHGEAALQDVVCGVGELNQSVGFASVAANGEMTMLSALNVVTPEINNCICYLSIDMNTYMANAAIRKFYDQYISIGQHIYGFSWATNEVTAIKVWRVTAASPTIDPADPLYIQLANIPVDMFGGTGYTYIVRAAMVDSLDQCVFLIVQGSIGTWMAKYNPYTGHVMWVTPITGLPDSIESEKGPAWGIIQGKYAWIDNANAVWRIDLSTGAVTEVMGDLSEQSLPDISNAKQFWNGPQNSITYLTADSGKRMTKFFVDRLARNTIELSDIVVNLVLRTGLLESDIDVEDLTSLTLYGYTIDSVKSIRDCFSELAQAFTYDVVESNGRIRFKTRGQGVDGTIPHAQIAATNDAGNENAWLIAHQQNDGARIRKINLTYKDIDRDFALSVQSIILSRYGVHVFDPEAAIDVSVPIVLTAQQAVQLGEILLYAKLTYNTTYEFVMSPRNLIYDAADVVTIAMPDGEDDITLRLREVTVNSDNSVQATASEENTDIYEDQVAVFGTLGRFYPRVIKQPPARIDALFLTIPGRSVEEIGISTTSHRLFLALLNTKVTAPALSQYLSVIANGITYTVSPPDGYPTWGHVVTPPEHTKSTASWDYESTVVVDIVNFSDFSDLTSVTEADLLDSDQVNLCYIAGELFQFTTVTDLGSDRFQFDGLARAKFGTDPYASASRAGDQFVLIAGSTGVVDTNSCIPLVLPIGTTPIKQLQVNIKTGNPFQPIYGMTVRAINMQPFRVADFRWSYVVNDVVMTWQRRSRTATGEYIDDGDFEAVTLPEASETYVLYLYQDPDTFDPAVVATYMRRVEITTPTFTYTAAMQTTDGFDRTTETLYVQVQQTGSITGIDDGAPEEHSLPHA